MKVLAIQGSPNKSGNTATLLKYYLLGLKENHHDAEIKLINIAEKSIQSCKGCRVCRKSERKCVIKDDMHEIYSDILEVDILILATPIYWCNITAQAKQFIDRLYALDFNNSFKGKKFVLLTTYEGDNPNLGADITKNMFRGICDFLGMDFIQCYGVCTRMTSMKENTSIQDDIYHLGKTTTLTDLD